MVLGGGVPLVGPQGELCSPSGYTPRGFFFQTRVGDKVRIVGFYTNKQTNKQGLFGPPATVKPPKKEQNGVHNHLSVSKRKGKTWQSHAAKPLDANAFQPTASWHMNRWYDVFPPWPCWTWRAFAWVWCKQNQNKLVLKISGNDYFSFSLLGFSTIFF